MDVVAAIWQSSTPLILAALAGVMASRAGVWHLGLGGILSGGALASVVIAKESGNWVLAIAGAALVSALMGAVMWVAIDRLKGNPIIVGIGMNALGLGGTILATVALYGSEGTVTSSTGIPRAFPDASGAVGQLSLIAIATPVLVFVVWWFLCRTRLGLKITATGDHPFAARSAGVSIPWIRFIALAGGGILCGLAGSELSLGTLQSFTPGMEAGRGLIAFAAVILGAAHPLGATLGAVLFGSVTYFGIWAQLNLGGTIPPEFLLMLPYAVVIVAVVITAQVRGSARNLTMMELKA